MTPQKFTAWAEDIFGKYRPAMKVEVERWLSPKDTYFIAAMCEIALVDHPSIYGKPPGVHELEVMKMDAYDLARRLEAKATLGTHKELTSDTDVPLTDEQREQMEKKIAELKAKLTGRRVKAEPLKKLELLEREKGGEG